MNITTAAAAENSWPVHVYRKTEQGWHRMKAQSSSTGRSVTVYATPRRNYIALLRLQVRIRLQSKNKTSSISDGGDTIHTTVIRRRHCLLVSSNQRLRSLVLRFRDVKACIAFADQLVALNSPPERRFLLDDAASSASSSMRHHGTVQENEQILSYVGRLLHSEDFAALVDNLEACILSSHDGARMLEALVNSSSGGGFSSNGGGVDKNGGVTTETH